MNSPQTHSVKHYRAFFRPPGYFGIALQKLVIDNGNHFQHCEINVLNMVPGVKLDDIDYNERARCITFKNEMV